jgi:hypothetical protein
MAHLRLGQLLRSVSDEAECILLGYSPDGITNDGSGYSSIHFRYVRTLVPPSAAGMFTPWQEKRDAELITDGPQFYIVRVRISDWRKCRYDTPAGPSCSLLLDEFINSSGVCECGSGLEVQDTAFGCQSRSAASQLPQINRRNRIAASVKRGYYERR